MRVTWNDLTAKFDAKQCDALLDDWRWLVGDGMRLIVVSALGDLFLANADGQVFWLEAGAGRLSQVADSREEFEALLQRQECADEWFSPQLVAELIVSGKTLAHGQCYSYTVPPILSGKVEPQNFEPTDLLVHCSLLGQICRQSRDLPEGTRVASFKTIERGDANRD
jgi:hypothetical protein